MSDFPASPQIATPTHIHSLSQFMQGQERGIVQAGSPASLTWTANLAIYQPLVLPWPYYIARMFWNNGNTASSSVDMGIYAEDGTLIAALGGIAQVTGGAVQYSSTNMGILVPAGRYYLGYSCNGTTARGFATACTAANGEAIGVVQQATAYPLPNPATFAAYAGIGLPFIGITRTASGF
jgi:hypothetical protein